MDSDEWDDEGPEAFFDADDVPMEASSNSTGNVTHTDEFANGFEDYTFYNLADEEDQEVNDHAAAKRSITSLNEQLPVAARNLFGNISPILKDTEKLDSEDPWQQQEYPQASFKSILKSSDASASPDRSAPASTPAGQRTWAEVVNALASGSWKNRDEVVAASREQFDLSGYTLTISRTGYAAKDDTKKDDNELDNEDDKTVTRKDDNESDKTEPPAKREPIRLCFRCTTSSCETKLNFSVVLRNKADKSKGFAWHLSSSNAVKNHSHEPDVVRKGKVDKSKKRKAGEDEEPEEDEDEDDETLQDRAIIPKQRHGGLHRSKNDMGDVVSMTIINMLHASNICASVFALFLMQYVS